MTKHPAARPYGWRPSRPDGRDHFALPEGAVDKATFPETFSLRPELPAVLDQGQLGSCTANALAGIFQYYNMLAGTDFGVPSRLFIYYLERLKEGTVTTDSGAYGRDGFAALRNIGAPPESDWPYIISQFASTPPQSAYDAATGHKINHYSAVRNKRAEVKHLVMLKKPVAFGFTVPQEFEESQCMSTGVMPMPRENTKILGGHEPYCIGWKPDDQYTTLWECRNSWSEGVQDEGNFWLPDAFLFGGWASDFRAIQN